MVSDASLRLTNSNCGCISEQTWGGMTVLLMLIDSVAKLLLRSNSRTFMTEVVAAECGHELVSSYARLFMCPSSTRCRSTGFFLQHKTTWRVCDSDGSGSHIPLIHYRMGHMSLTFTLDEVHDLIILTIILYTNCSFTRCLQ